MKERFYFSIDGWWVSIETADPIAAEDLLREENPGATVVCLGSNLEGKHLEDDLPF